MTSLSYPLDRALQIELEHAFKRNGWKISDIEILCERDMLKHVLFFLKEFRETPSVLVSQERLHRVQEMEASYKRIIGDESLGPITYERFTLAEFFTEKRCASLGYHKPSTGGRYPLNTILNFLPNGGEMPIHNVSDLTKFTESELRKIPHIGNGCVDLIRVTLGSVGLALKGELPVRK